MDTASKGAREELVSESARTDSAEQGAPTAVKAHRPRAPQRLASDDRESLKEVKRGGAGAAAVCFLIGGHSVTSALLEHHLIDALQRACVAALCGLIFLAAAWLVGRLRGRDSASPRGDKKEVE
jgi:hypothetical protein